MVEKQRSSTSASIEAAVMFCEIESKPKPEFPAPVMLVTRAFVPSAVLKRRVQADSVLGLFARSAKCKAQQNERDEKEPAP